MDTDTGELAEVPEEERLDTDEGEGANALDETGPDDDLDDVYENPGEVVEEDLT